MAIENVAQDSACSVASPDDLESLYQRVMTCKPLVHPSELDALRNLAEDASLTVRPWLFMAYAATRDGAFYKELSEDATRMRLLAPLSMILEEFAERMHMVAEMSKGAAMRIRVAGCNHEDFDVWRKEDPNADIDGGAAHV